MKFAYLWRHKPGGVTFEKNCPFSLWHTVTVSTDGIYMIMMLHTQPAILLDILSIPLPPETPSPPHMLTPPDPICWPQPTHHNFPPKMITTVKLNVDMTLASKIAVYYNLPPVLSQNRCLPEEWDQLPLPRCTSSAQPCCLQLDTFF